MTKEAQRIAIAEVLGFRNVQIGPWYGYKKSQYETELAYDVPDYLTDLNAMHEAENSAIFPKCLGMVYGRELQVVCSKEPKIEIKGVVFERWSFSATAAQRTEAFLRVKGLWVEEKVEVSAGK